MILMMTILMKIMVMMMMMMTENDVHRGSKPIDEENFVSIQQFASAAVAFSEKARLSKLWPNMNLNTT